MADLERAVGRMEGIIERMEKSVEKLETRVESLSNFKLKVVGGAAVVSAVVGFLVSDFGLSIIRKIIRV